MGTEVLHPQHWLTERMRVGPAVFPRRKSYYGGNPKPSRKQVTRPEPRKRSPSQSEPSVSRKWSGNGNGNGNGGGNSSDDSSKSSSKNFFTGQVTILKRGESLDSSKRSWTRNNNHNAASSSSSSSSNSTSVDLIVSGTERLGPDPEMVPKQIRVADLKVILSPVAVRSDMYAGAAFSLSPSPSSLPLPSFSMKKDGLAIVDYSATKDLRRLLRLD
ncbi:dachshund homolog 1-like [Macadamia integrifolia]|uniref:dachshund homolog 1-like n=1 Tax=Macadamia integrifolia TaxID=60698 RepID=UPI001C4FC49D|nr:dachshund homolog 1-like [Macadamia integrifolia]